MNSKRGLLWRKGDRHKSHSTQSHTGPCRSRTSQATCLPPGPPAAYQAVTSHSLALRTKAVSPGGSTPPDRIPLAGGLQVPFQSSKEMPRNWGRGRTLIYSWVGLGPGQPVLRPASQEETGPSFVALRGCVRGQRLCPVWSCGGALPASACRWVPLARRQKSPHRLQPGAGEDAPCSREGETTPLTQERWGEAGGGTSPCRSPVQMSKATGAGRRPSRS